MTDCTVKDVERLDATPNYPISNQLINVAPPLQWDGCECEFVLYRDMQQLMDALWKAGYRPTKYGQIHDVEEFYPDNG